MSRVIGVRTGARHTRRVLKATAFTAVAPLEWRLPFSPGAIQRVQRHQLRATIAQAHQHVPYYQETMRRLGLGPADFQTAEDLAKLPLLEREQLQADPEYFVSRAQPLVRYVEVRTSGSTGRPIVFFRHVPGILQRSLGFERMEPMLARLLGVRWSRRDAVIVPPRSWRANPDAAPQVQWLGLHLRARCRNISLFEPPAKIARELDEFRPHLVKSYGSLIEAVYTHLLATGRDFHRPKAVSYAGDAVSEPVRRLLREELGIAVLSIYQAVEVGLIGWQCERQAGHHLNIDLCPIRIVDGEGRELPRGEPGEVVVSNLVNRGTVVLNYRLGDLAARLPEPCACGRSLPMLSDVQGRRTDWLESRSGQPIHPQALRSILRSVDGVRRFQLVQERPGEVRVVAVIAPEAARDGIRSQIVDDVRRLDSSIDAEVEFAESLPRTEGGKVRTLLRHEASAE
jgi:phenylacetate-CoA ligase